LGSDFGKEEAKEVNAFARVDLTIDSNDLMVFGNFSCLHVSSRVSFKKDVLGAVFVNNLKLKHLAIVGITFGNELFDVLTSKLNFSNIGGTLMFAIKPGRLNAM